MYSITWNSQYGFLVWKNSNPFCQIGGNLLENQSIASIFALDVWLKNLFQIGTLTIVTNLILKRCAKKGMYWTLTPVTSSWDPMMSLVSCCSEDQKRTRGFGKMFVVHSTHLHPSIKVWGFFTTSPRRPLCFRAVSRLVK